MADTRGVREDRVNNGFLCVGSVTSLSLFFSFPMSLGLSGKPGQSLAATVLW